MVDHVGYGMYEGFDEFPEFHESCFNKGEAELVAIAYDQLITEMDLYPDDIGIIAPHWVQVSQVF